MADFSGEKPAYHLIKVDLPASVIDLADDEHKTWPKSIDAAIAELKEKLPNQVDSGGREFDLLRGGADLGNQRPTDRNPWAYLDSKRVGLC